MVYSKVKAKPSSLCINRLFGTSNIFFGQVYYGHLLVPGQV